jgi:hypothetical protein
MAEPAANGEGVIAAVRQQRCGTADLLAVKVVNRGSDSFAKGASGPAEEGSRVCLHRLVLVVNLYGRQDTSADLLP